MPGYRDPPVHSRFKPGQSGNPGGGPKGPRSKPIRRSSRFLDEKVTCTIGGHPFKGQRREAVVQFAARWSISKAVSGSKARGATEQEKLRKPNFGLQQLLLKLMEQEEEKERRIRRDEPVYVIRDLPSLPGRVSCIEDAAEVAGFGIKAYRKQKSARVLLDNWIIEDGLDRFGDRRLNREEQKQVLAATRFPKKIEWPEWWEPDLHERGKRWRAPTVTRAATDPKVPETVRISFTDYLAEAARVRLWREEIDYSREYHAMSRRDQALFGKPFERPGRPSRDGQLNPVSTGSEEEP